MAEQKDELEKSLEGDEEISSTEKRIKDLSSKTKEAFTERDAAIAEADKAKEEAQKTKKELEFVNVFSEQVAKYPAAKDHKDEIKQKVFGGYSVEDATVAVLSKQGKLKTADEMNRDSIRGEALGGSADTQIRPNAQKSASEMSQEERRKALLDSEEKGEWGFADGKLFTRR